MNPTIIYYIDQSYMKPSEKTSVPKRSKYIEIKHYILRDEVQKREVVLQYIFTDEQIADILVKPLSKMKEFAYLSWSSWEKEEMTPKLGESTDVLLIYGK